jgi:hypothetical protein
MMKPCLTLIKEQTPFWKGIKGDYNKSLEPDQPQTTKRQHPKNPNALVDWSHKRELQPEPSPLQIQQRDGHDLQ